MSQVLTDAELRATIREIYGSDHFPGDLLIGRKIEAAVLAKVQPVAWTLQSVLDAKKTTNLAPLWFSNPRNTAWTPLYTITQPAPLHNEGPEEKP